MPKKTFHSHVDRNGNAYFKHTGRYHEVKREMTVPKKRDSTAGQGDALSNNKKSLCNPSSSSAASVTLKHVRQELGF